MLKYVVEYVFFERARVWMYLLCDEVFFAWKFLLFFLLEFSLSGFLLFFSFFSPFLEMVLFIYTLKFLNPN